MLLANPTRAPWAARPLDARRLATWALFAAVLTAAPLLWSSTLGHTVLSQIGITIIACLSYNLLLGQTGMLSFGHAVYSGLGAFAAIHTLRLVSAGTVNLPVSLLPLVGGLAGLLFAALFGFVTTRRAGTPFAMITLGIGELVWAMAPMLPEVFGGESGISGNRVVGPPVFGISYGPQIQLYYLIAAYCLVSTAALHALTRTPLGRMLNAVRDNPERVEFIGYSTQHVRYLAFMIAGFFAGIAGGLVALSFEIVTAEVLGAATSGGYLLFTFLGGTTVFFGPIIGAVLMVLATTLLSEVTKAWLLYLGLVFLLMVTYAPGGLASIVMANVRVAAFGKLGRLVTPYLAALGSAGVLLAGASALIEMTYHLQLEATLGTTLRFFGIGLDTRSATSWLGAVLVFGIGLVLFEIARRRLRQQWSTVQEEIASETRQRSAP